jgi:hypothetical protein
MAAPRQPQCEAFHTPAVEAHETPDEMLPQRRPASSAVAISRLELTMKTIVAAAVAGLALAGSVLPAHADHWGYRYYGRPYYGYDRGASVAAGIAGLAAGALIAGAIASQAATPPPPPGTVDPNLAAYCARKYRSYDPVTGTFLARSGERFVCTY